MKKERILILLDHMAVGGAARVTSLLLEHLAETGVEVVFATDNVNCDTFYPVPKEIRTIAFPAKCKGLPIFKQVKLIASARKIIRNEKPALVIAVTFAPFFYAYFASLGTGIPVVAYDHTSFTRKMGVFADFIRYHLYKKADNLVLLTKKDSRIVQDYIPHNTLIYNPLTYHINKNEGHFEKAVLCAGRLDSWDVKGFDRIIVMWSEIKEAFPDWKLVIAGGGNDEAKDYLRSLSEKHGVGDCVEFLGQIEDMASVYERFPIFALPSRVEGFPMVLLEAMSQGCVCVSFEMDGAVREMTDETASFIIPDNDEKKFVAGLCDAMRMYPDYEKEKQEGWMLCSRFSRDSFNRSWDEFLKRYL